MPRQRFVRSLGVCEERLVAVIGCDVVLNEIADVDRVLPIARDETCHQPDSVVSRSRAGFIGGLGLRLLCELLSRPES